MAARQGGSRLGLYLGLGAAGAGGYYLYRAGGNPRVAEKAMEHDAAKAYSRMRGEDAKGKKEEARTAVNLHAQDVGAKIDHTIEQARETTNKIDQKLENYRANAEKKIDEVTKETAKEVHSAIDNFDRTVEKKAAETKGWLSSWFGGK